jgi:hypothetical protein
VADGAPCLEDFLAGWQGEERLGLLRQLVLIDLAPSPPARGSRLGRG